MNNRKNASFKEKLDNNGDFLFWMFEVGGKIKILILRYFLILNSENYGNTRVD